LGNVAKDCSALGVDPKTLVTLGVHLEAVESIKVADEAVVKDQAAIVEDLNRQLADLRKEVADLTEKLDAPTSVYQGYLEALRQWQSKRDELVGDDQRPETLNYIKNRITGLDAIPNEIMEAEASREAKVREIFREIKALVEAYRELYQPVQSSFRTIHSQKISSSLTSMHESYAWDSTSNFSDE